MTRIDPPTPPALPALWLPLLGGLLPFVATLVALLLSQHLALIPACNPLVEGCVSISRAARHDLPNYIFRALLLPAAALQALTWWIAASWLRQHGAGGRLLRALPWVGLVAACFLALYGSFLGTEGEAYRWLRRYGVIFYFGCTCIAMVTAAGLTHRHLRDGALRWPARVLVAATFALPMMGVASATAPLYLASESARDALENILEWWAGLAFTAFFVALAWAWQRARLKLTLHAG